MEKDTFIKIIQDCIQFHQNQVESIMEQNGSTFEMYKQFYSALEENLENITYLSLEDIKDILEKSSLPVLDQENEFQQLSSIMELLELNQTKGTTFQLTEGQIACLKRLKDQIKQLETLSKNVMSKQLTTVTEHTNRVKKLKALLGKVEDQKNMEYLLDEDLLQELLSSFDEKTQEEILYFVLHYNRSLYLEKMNQKMIEEKPRLNIEEVKEIFQNFGYNFMDLKPKAQDYLLTYGQIQKIPVLFECLERNYLPKLDLKRNGKKLVALLVNSDVQTMEDIFAYSTEKEIPLPSLLEMIPVLVKQEKHPKNFMIGRSEDFKRNIDFLVGTGLSIPFILHTCKEVLMMSHIKLVANYQKFSFYGFQIPEEEDGDLCSSTFSCLLMNDFDEIVDQFIEIRREGHSYLLHHVSRATTVLSPMDVLFYRLYLSRKTQEEIDSVIDSLDYQEINDQNKQEITGTVSVSCPMKEEFDRAVLKHRGHDEMLYDLIVNDEKILSLDSYIDHEDPLRYQFDGILISRPKVLRIYNILKNEHLDSLEDSLFYAITYQSILSQEEVDSIKSLFYKGGQ